MLKIEEIKKIDKKHIALMDTSSLSFIISQRENPFRRESVVG